MGLSMIQQQLRNYTKLNGLCLNESKLDMPSINKNLMQILATLSSSKDNKRKKNSYVSKTE